MDSQGNYISANTVAETLTGYNKEQLLSLKFKDLISSHRLEDAAGTFIKVKQGKAIRKENILVHKDGHHIIVDVNVVPVYKDDGTVNVIVFLQDITDKKRAEEEIKNLAYKDTLTGLPNRYLFSIKLEAAIKRVTSKVVGLFFSCRPI